jgi:hypothetical protein
MIPSLRFYFSLALESIFKEASHNQHNLKIAALYCSALAMERLLSPCTRLYDILENQGYLEQFRGRHPEGLQELNLNVSTEELLSAERAFTYVDLSAMLGNRNTVAWLTPHAAVARTCGGAIHSWNQLGGSCGVRFSADDKEIIAMALSPEHLLEICDVILRLLAVSVVPSLFIKDEWSSPDGAVINATTLAHLMEQCQSLKVLTLNHLTMDEDHCRVLGSYSRPGLEIVLRYCKITSAGASALAESLGRNQGPTKLVNCHIDNSVLAEGLRGNSSLKSFTPCSSRNPEDSNRQFLAITGALQENKGLVELNLTCYGPKMNGEAWGAICNSLEAHPTLEVLDLRGALGHAAPTPAMLKSRIQALLDTIKVNTSIHTIHLNDRFSHHELFRGSVIPYLETNRFRPSLLAIQRTRPIPYRAKVLGRALLSARTDANRFWMLLSGNAEVAFPSRSTTIAAAVNLPTPHATATTTVTGSLPIVATAAAAAATSSAAPPSTASASDASAPTVAANAATPSAGQKRRARR